MLKNIIVFAFGSFGTKIIAFLLIPLYTHTLTKGEFGYIELINVLVFILVPIISFQLSDASYRFLLDASDDKERGKIISSTIIVILFSTIIFGIVSYFISQSSVNDDILQDRSILVFWVCISAMFIGVFKQIARGIEKSMAFAATDILQTTLLASGAIYLLHTKGMGVDGYFYSLIFSNVFSICILVTWIKIWRYVRLSLYSSVYAKEMLKYGAPLVPNVLAWWFINASDRFILVEYTNFDTVGLYALAFKYASILMIFSSIFTLAWQTTANQLYKSSENKAIFSKVFKVYYVFFVAVSIFMLLVQKPIVKVIATPDYFGSWVYIPFLLGANFFVVMAGFYSVTHLLAKRTASIFYSTLVVGLLNIILNIAFVPKFGAVASAVGTCISCFAMWIIRIIDTRKYIDVVIDKIHLSKNLVLFAIAGVIQYLNMDIMVYIMISCMIVIMMLLTNYSLLKECVSIVKELILKLKARLG
ncbi:oligosaccharide flippase family protein [Bacillus sp. AS_5]|uniref:lipopolysaccharide biosynthesis protein n=1 Tax=unclassified Bacillus (in: firmicutes) TaxID=185979 RepID=UPI0012626DDD|nr:MULTISPECIES: oligosaccharide flippase family protein [unclassified Bacillus (in: firmicutes)]KAB7679816.1 oligosaccharide flippase family protein [Bacillus sp. B1-WWTP-T-0.5-Post-4]MCW4653461.1 oligosaccharide flippase family protein [Bacillus sp. AS_3]MCX2702804.1 oligosaccharide flippase family protein [Bacillus sp. AS_5]